MTRTIRGCSIYEYTLNSAGDWQTKQYGRKALTKLVKKTMEGSVDSVDLPYISRGDDGNLYALMQVKLYDENANPLKNKVVRVNTISLPLMKIQMRCKRQNCRLR